ncbi:MAG: hypothetical protein PHN88_04520 [Ignavibacteria bacterium]|nr:hypothetical protein [Ignavibacteria bacterium]
MSGPKCISKPPPLFSGKAFQGKLKDIFELQASIRSLLDKTNDSKIFDKNLGIDIDCKADVQFLEKEIKSQLRAYTLEVNKEYSLNEYNAQNAEITKKINDLKLTINNLALILSQFEDARNDYYAYVELIEYLEQVKNELESSKTNLLSSLKIELTSDNIDIYEDVSKKLMEVEFDYIVPDFSLGFRNKRNKEVENLQLVVQNIDKRFTFINSLAISDIVKRIPESKLDITILLKESESSKKNSYTGKKAEIISKINNFISSIDNPARRNKASQQLRNMNDKDKNKTVFHYEQLLSDIIETEKTATIKNKTNKILVATINLKLHKELEKERTRLYDAINEILDKKAVKENDFQGLNFMYQALINRDSVLSDKENLIIQENEFMKEQMIKAFMDLGYEVMTDLEVIDFEKDSNVVLSVPNQENFINLTFNDKQITNYSFLIPEDKKDLSNEQIESKVTEMENTCKDLKSFVKWLNENDVKVELTPLMKANADALITVPEKIKHIIKNKKQITNQKKKLKTIITK